MPAVRLVIVCLVAAAVAGAADQKTPDDILAQARALFEAGRYDSTAALVRGYLQESGKQPVTEHLVPVLMESMVRSSNPAPGPRLMDIYVKRFPSSPYLPRMYYLDGVLKVRAREYADAVVSFSKALGVVNPQLDSLAAQNVLMTCDQALTLSEVSSLLRRDDLHPRAREMLTYSLVRKDHAAKQLARAGKAARDFIAQFPQSRFVTDVERIASQSIQERGSDVPVGLLAPLSGYDADIGKRILQGAQLAVDEHNRSGGRQVRLVADDTRSSMVETARRTHELIAEHEVPIILGPVLSQNAIVSAAMLVDRDVVMISPTATEDGIAELGPNIFQMNPTAGVLSQSVAQYAMSNLHINEFAVLAPLSDYGRSMAEGFKAEVARVGGQVVFEEYFDERTSDMRPEFMALRQTLFERKRSRDSAIVAATPPATRRTHRDDSLCLADSTLPVGGLFIPAEAENVVMVAPQVQFFKIKTQLFGATGWHSPQVITDGKKYVENAIFVTNGETDQKDSLWLDFAERYRRKFNADADHVSALGYDAARLIGLCVAGIGDNLAADRVIAWLRSVQGYRGVSGMISFEPSRGVNREVVIMKILDKRFIRVQ